MLYLSGDPKKYEETVVVGDEVQIYTEAETLLDGLMVFLAVYYIFDLADPKMYSQLLGILQEYIINEPLFMMILFVKLKGIGHKFCQLMKPYPIK